MVVVILVRRCVERPGVNDREPGLHSDASSFHVAARRAVPAPADPRKRKRPWLVPEREVPDERIPRHFGD